MTPRAQSVAVQGPFDFQDRELTFRALQISVNGLLSWNACYKIEGDVCSSLATLLPLLYRRGDEKSPIDGGLVLTIRGGKVIGIEVKSLASRLRHERQGGNSGSFWEFDVQIKENQIPCDLFCIGFPFLRQPGWFAVHTDLRSRLTMIDVNAARFRNTLSEAGHQIDNVVPPHFWKYMTQLSDAATIFEQICENGDSHAGQEGTDPSGVDSSMDHR